MSGLNEILLRDLRVLDSNSYLIEVATNQLVDIVSHGRAVLHVVLEGVVTIALVGGDQTLTLHAGETATCFYGDHHRLNPGGDMAPVTLSLGDGDTDSIEQIAIHADGAPRRRGARMLSTVFSFAHVSPAAYSIRAGLSLWRMGRDGGNGSNSALAFDPDQITEDCGGPGARAAIASFSTLMLIRSIRNMHRSLWNDREMPVWAPNARRIASALLAIHAQPEREWTVATLAREVGLSRSCFASAFAAEVGMTPMAYLTQIRMRRAAQLLQSERFAIAEVSRRVGYRIPSSFTRAFTSYHGVPPSHFAQEDDTGVPTRQ
ncbi:AraC family transcriptional regulator [Sphingobium sp. YR768]|uniref:AraC family transcriptional regulator n=1 Tax=Sphingobium sp. YR768 TaxID=1884365 RepID=UPI0008C7A1C0|nr:AraC family transcriptional regulator [Sphingobium sp. YR768]SER79767.1 AraC-type DNA-binding protein [Sphingobium sp. YR768]